MQLSEKYRPRALEELLGQPKAVERVRRIIGRDGFTGDAFWIAGPPGTGKTSLAKIIARTFCDDFDICELDGCDCDVDAVREASRMMRYGTLSGRFRGWIVNEAQAMTSRAVQAWLTVLDPCPSRTIVVFTTTADSADLFGEYESPFRSRCKSIPFTAQGVAPALAPRLKAIAVAEGLDGQDEGAYKRLLQRPDVHNNIRYAMQEIEAGAMLA